VRENGKTAIETRTSPVGQAQPAQSIARHSGLASTGFRCRAAPQILGKVLILHFPACNADQRKFTRLPVVQLLPLGTDVSNLLRVLYVLLAQAARTRYLGHLGHDGLRTGLNTGLVECVS
jgi:hypothetical protein